MGGGWWWLFQDLLLTIHNDTCYYSWVPDGEGEDRVLSNRMNFVEVSVSFYRTVKYNYLILSCLVLSCFGLS